MCVRRRRRKRGEEEEEREGDEGRDMVSSRLRVLTLAGCHLVTDEGLR